MSQFYYSKTGEDIHGPIDESDLIALYQANGLPHSTKVRPIDTEEWHDLTQVLQIEKPLDSMKSSKSTVFSSIATLLSLSAIGISIFSLQKIKSIRELPSGDDPKSVVESVLAYPKWTGPNAFYKAHTKELQQNLAIANMFESENVALVFWKTSADNKNFFDTTWLRKDNEKWAQVSYLSSSYSGDPAISAWTERNKGWLEDMQEKKEAWEKQTSQLW